MIAIRSRRRNGFSLLETIIVVAIFAAMIFVIAALRNNVNVLENIVNQRLRSRKDIDQVIQTMITDIRSANRSSAGGYAIEAASSSSLIFYSDIDRDGIFERVRYAMSTSSIIKGVVEPVGNPLAYPTSSEMVSTVVDYVTTATTTPLFSYYHSSSTGTEAAMTEPIVVTQIRSVRIMFGADVEPGKAPKELFFSNTITIRNLHSN